MPSIKSCLTSLAFMAFTIAPVISAKGHAKGSAIVARDAHIARAVVSPSAGLEKRVSSEKRAAAKSAAKKRALARRAAKAAAKAEPKRGDPYAPGSVFQSSVVALAAQNRKCAKNKNCLSIQLIPNSYAVCFERRCSLRCNTGFQPGGADGQECVAAASSCPQDGACPTVTNGYATCTADGFCQLNCNTAQGLSLTQNQDTGAFSCISLTSDVNNCGSARNVCPDSYNGVGTPVCRRGQCTIRCTAGTYPYRTTSADRPYLCR